MRHKNHCFLSAVFFLFASIQWVDGGGSQVRHLPGFEGPLPIHLETGYVGVDEGENVQLFYFFVKSMSDPDKDPVLLWLLGGPGCSSLASLLFEIGPLLINREDDESLPTISMQTHSFAEAANVIYLDMPVGTGYSYARTPEALRSTGMQSCRHTHQFVRKWLVDHPEFASNPFYVGGNSYVGINVPVIVQLISNGNEVGFDQQVKLKGYVLGNPGTFPDEANYRIPFAHGMGLIPEDLYESLKQNCKGNYVNVDPNNFPCLKDVQTFHELVADIFQDQILETKCSDPHPIGDRKTEETQVLDNKDVKLHNTDRCCTESCYSLKQTCKANNVGEDSGYLQCPMNVQTLHQLVDDVFGRNLETTCNGSSIRIGPEDGEKGSPNRRHQEPNNNKQRPPMRSCFNYRLKFINFWASDPHVQEALHVRKGTAGEFVICNYSIPHTNFMWDSTPYHMNLSAKGYRSLIYSGDHDMVVPFQSTQAWIRSLNYSIVDEWRPWYVEGLVAGYTRSYANSMTFATVKVRGGPHTPGASYPRECAAMLKRWMSYQPL